MALKNLDVSKGLIFHLDQGVQYANNMFASSLDSYKVVSSMSSTGNCWDNQWQKGTNQTVISSI